MDQGMLLITAATCGCTPVVRQIPEKGSLEDNRPWGSQLFPLGSEKTTTTYHCCGMGLYGYDCAAAGLWC